MAKTSIPARVKSASAKPTPKTSVNTTQRAAPRKTIHDWDRAQAAAKAKPEDLVVAVTLEPFLRPEFPADDPRCLPFVRDCTKAEEKSGGSGRLFWAPDSLPDHWQNLSPGQQGLVCAVAYLLYVDAHQDLRTGVGLYTIMSAMPDHDRRAIGFCSHLERYLLAIAHLSSPNEIRAYGKKMVEFDRAAMIEHFGSAR